MRKFGLFVAFVVLLACGAGYGVWHCYNAAGPLAQSKPVVIPHGGVHDVGQKLQQEGVIPGGRFFAGLFRAMAFVTQRDGPIRAAEFSFPEHASLRQVLVVLRKGRPVLHPLTIPEGLRAIQIAHILEAASFLSGPLPPLHDGEILPQTYNYVRGTSRKEAVEHMQKAMSNTAAEIWSRRDSSATQLLKSRQQMVILASIVEKETAVQAERPQVAQVFLNRLRLGMRLQSDPTVLFARDQGGEPTRLPITRDNLKMESPYNTYVVSGLPPGPICSPGREAMEAVAHPAGGDALYFVADGKGGHVFAKSLTEHNRNVIRFRKREGRSAARPPHNKQPH